MGKSMGCNHTATAPENPNNFRWNMIACGKTRPTLEMTEQARHYLRTEFEHINFAVVSGWLRELVRLRDAFLVIVSSGTGVVDWARLHIDSSDATAVYHCRGFCDKPLLLVATSAIGPGVLLRLLQQFLAFR